VKPRETIPPQLGVLRRVDVEQDEPLLSSDSGVTACAWRMIAVFSWLE
jgi:hypothetical protein